MKRTLYFPHIISCILPLTVGSVYGIEKKPNIVLILADDLGFGDVGFTGSDIKTPNIDRIAAEGVKFTQFYACPMSSPSRAELMTGRYPIRFGMMRSVIPPEREYGLPDEEFTVAEMLGEAGYKYRGMAGKWHLGHRQHQWLPTQNGFNFYEGCYNGDCDYFTQDRDGERDWHENEVPSTKVGYTTDLIGDASVGFINSVPTDEQFFLYVPFTAPHSPYQAKDEDIAKYPNRSGNKQIYAAMVDCMDQNIGRILKCLEDRGQLDNTFILFSSDNGGILKVSSNGDLRGEKLTPYQGGINVVAAARWPNGKISGGKTITQRIGNIDVLPTLMEIGSFTGTVSNELDGINVLKAMQGETMPDRKWFTYLDQGNNKNEALAMNTDQWKLIWTRNAPDNNVSFEKVELYKISSDKAEASNVSAQNTVVVAQLKQDIEKFYAFKLPNQIPRYSEHELLTGPNIYDWQPITSGRRIKVKSTGMYIDIDTKSLALKPLGSRPANGLLKMIEGLSADVVYIRASNNVNLKYILNSTNAIAATGGEGENAQFEYIDLGNNEFSLKPILMPNNRVRYNATQGNFDPMGLPDNVNTVFVWEDIISTSIHESFNSNEFEIYPIPANDKVFIKWKSGMQSNVKIYVYSLLGVEMKTIMLESTQLNESEQIDLSDLKAGIYLLVIENGKNTRFIKLIKNNYS